MPSAVISDTLGCKINFTPSKAPSNVKDLITMTIKKTNSNGIITFDAFSNPFSTPNMTIIIVANMNIPCPRTVNQGFDITASKFISWR
ncbi:Uncharacterised protein [Staphylococcus aureus]|nr:Uncharacterised protein [Staphylococcus aureus]